VDDAPFCEFSGNDELWPEGQPGSVVFCTAEHTVTQEEFDAEEGVSNTASVSADDLDPVMTSLTIPVALFASGFESPPNTITVLDDSDNVVGYHNDIAIGDDSYPVISHLDYTDGVLLVAKCNDEACRDGDEMISLVDDGNVGSYSSITIGFDGLPVISYYDRVNGKLKVAHCNDAACSGEGEIVTTLNDAAEGTGVNTSIAIGDDGFPVISCQTFTSPCTGGDETFMAVDFSTTYMRLSLVLAPDGNPLVSYMGSLKLARCNDDACAGEDESIAIVDSAAKARSSSIAIGADGLPVISYFDETTGALKVVHCGTLECR